MACYMSVVPRHVRLVPGPDGGGGGLVSGGGGGLVAGGGGGLVAGLGHRHLRGRVLGGHGRRQVGTLRLEAVVVGGVGVAVVVGVAVLALDGVAGITAIASHRLARLGGRDAVLGLVAAKCTGLSAKQA